MKYTFEQLLQRDTCQARTRKGTPCKRRDIYYNGRCPLHGGLSTGPQTPEGKAKVTRNLPTMKDRESQPGPGQTDADQDQTPWDAKKRLGIK